jgi:hypothetical protein
MKADIAINALRCEAFSRRLKYTRLEAIRPVRKGDQVGQTHLNWHLNQASQYIEQVRFLPSCQETLALDAAIAGFILF